MTTTPLSHLPRPTSLIGTLADDLTCKALWCYESDSPGAMIKAMLTDGTMAMVYYRLMQWSRRYGLTPLEMLFNRLNSMLCACVIGRGAEFGPGFVIIHSSGIVINGAVRAGCGVHIEHQVTIGAECRETPTLGDNVFIGAGAKIIGGIALGNGVRVGANAVVLEDVPDYHTAVGVPAKAIPQKQTNRKRAPEGGLTHDGHRRDHHRRLLLAFSRWRPVRLSRLPGRDLRFLPPLWVSAESADGARH